MVKSVALVFCFFVLFGSLIKIQLNRDLFVQPASLTEVSKWLSSVYKVICPTVNDLWVSKFRKVDVPCVSGWIVNDSTRIVDIIKQLNISRSEVDKASTLLLQSFDFSILYTKIDLMDLKALMKVLINKVFHEMLRFHCF